MYTDSCELSFSSMFGWLVADGWCWFVLREEYCWLVAGGWFVQREKYWWLISRANRLFVGRESCNSAL
jgi:hypothetical protein